MARPPRPLARRGTHPWTLVGAGAIGRRVALSVALGCLLAATLTTPALAKAPSASTLAAYLREDKTLAYKYANIEGAKLGVSLPGGPETYLHIVQSAQYTLSGKVGERTVVAGALTGTYFYDDGSFAYCQISVPVAPHKMGVIRQTMAHEVFHCYEAVMALTEANWERKPSPFWLKEGASTWVEANLVGAHLPPQSEQLAEYFSSPSTPLFARDYDADGFFVHMQSVGISPWTRFKAMFEARSNAAAYQAGVAGNQQFFETEASVFFREPSGWPWAPRPDSAPHGGVDFQPSTIAVGGSGHPPVSVDAYADGVYHLVLSTMSSRKPVLELRVREGYVRIRSSNGHVDQVVSGTIKLCALREGCNCPGHDEHAPVFLDGNLAITGATTGGEVELIAGPRCEPDLAARSCDGELPGYSSTVADITEERLGHFTGNNKFTITESRNAAAGYVSFTCTFLFKESSSIIMKPIPLEPESGERGVEPPHLLPGEAPPEEEVFHGVIASGFNISRYGTKQAAIDGLQLQVRLGGASKAPVHGVGEEAFLTTTERDNSRGEDEYSSAGFVRVRNLTAYFLIAGDEEADPTWALSLLRAVAREL
jgi:hypothetical protein